MTKKFQRHTEDFVCENCGTAVEGNGFTNHCPACLHSKHVDINPGDRAETCHGLLVPVGLEQKAGGWVVNHVCKKCGKAVRCKTLPQDIDGVLKLAKKLADQRSK